MKMIHAWKLIFHIVSSHFNPISDHLEQLQEGHLVTLLHKKLLEEVTKLNLPETRRTVSSLITKLRVMADRELKDESLAEDSGARGMSRAVVVTLCSRAVSGITPFIHQYLGLVQSYLLHLLSTHRVTCKLSSVLLGMFTELASKGFCLPPEIEEEASGEGATDFEDIEGGGLGEGEGMKDVSDQIESEDQVSLLYAVTVTYPRHCLLLLLLLSSSSPSCEGTKFNIGGAPH